MVIVQGDVALQVSRMSSYCDPCLWDISSGGTAIVPYDIDSEYSDTEKTLITAALQEFNTMTCVQFTKRTVQTNYVYIVPSGGCWSYIGKTGGKQIVSVDGCLLYGIIQHELCHSLGLYHEHTRINRDSYIDIIWKYISPGDQGDFFVDKNNNPSVPYDYSSIMHYGRFASSNTSNEPTLIPKPNPNIQIGQINGLSNLDVMKINELYGCNLCRTKQLDPSGQISSLTLPSSQTNANCLWLIQVPSNKVSLQIDLFDSPSNTCDNQINVYDGPSKSDSLLFTLCPNNSLPMVVSSNNFMLMEYVRKLNIPSIFMASYSSVQYGGTFINNNGIVYSPNFPDFYPNNIQSTLTIIAPHGFMVSLSILIFNVEWCPSCKCDSLTVKNGGNSQAPNINGPLCGSDQFKTFISTGNMMFLQFQSDISVDNVGFKAKYSFVKK
ncbi:hypothetical protein GDO86_009921 [Hymenochirus boettgeri]|uniref:Metalloendopeptidase n=1 Tax=Hymenochirus boettgeri TaxID=247094 RepID=A0A8T2JKY5_9PIPI|nr:hypothetical protein GDO86_009921 [Hymenochirus boettgeri]